MFGYSLVDVFQGVQKRLDPQSIIRRNCRKLVIEEDRLEELEYLLEFKISSVRLELCRITDDYKKRKFDHLLQDLPFVMRPDSDKEKQIKASVAIAECSIEDIESDIYSYIITKYRFQRRLRKTARIVVLTGNAANNIPPELSSHYRTPWRMFYYKKVRKVLLVLLFIFLFLMSTVVLGLILMNGFGIDREFLRTILTKLPEVYFLLFFNTYLGYLAYMVVHGVLKSHIQGFRGLLPNHNTDVYSLIGFAR